MSLNINSLPVPRADKILISVAGSNPNADIHFKLLNNKALSPRRSSPCTDDLNLYSAETAVVVANSSATISTGLSMQISPNARFLPWVGYYTRITHLKEMVAKCVTVTGTVENSYLKEIKVDIHNKGSSDYNVCAGDRIAQLIIEYGPKY